MKTILTIMLTLALVLAIRLPVARAAPPAASEPRGPAVAPSEPDDALYPTTVSLRHARDRQHVHNLDTSVLQAGDADGSVTVVDIMRVAAERGWSCGSDAAPNGGETSAAALLPAWVLAPTRPAVVSIEPVTSTVRAGEAFTAAVVISDVVNLGAFQFAMTYSPKVVHVGDATLGPFPGSTGREFTPLGPTIDNEAGELIFGAYSVGTQSGPSGYGLLCAIKFTAQGPGATLLDLDPVQVLFPRGEPQDVSVEDRSVRVVGTQIVYLPLILKE